ncbi:MAG TPA: asparagine synthase (glutamine-hydrolyzing) [Candidatus Limnocylindrales bacterium]|nr:asparagine synthase (glutamine-hydrolyzing) [Candidatus Limnocylindrales bacterium]
MCGIAAFFSTGKPVSAQALKRATRALHHRGPDSNGAWISSDSRVGLGHARLSIIDLTTGDQPIANEDGSIRIIVNGEFYDFERQRRELEARGHQFRTRSDSEIALHLYEEFGVHCAQHLRGEFAFVIWDQPNQRLFAARDRFGIKPLHYAVHDGVLYIASEIKALFAAGVPARWDHEYFYQHATGPAMPDRTLFEGVHQVPAGYCLTASQGGIRLLRYWEFYYPPAEEIVAERRDEYSYVEEFSAVFEEAVRLRMRADVPVGCYLSGGLDSCATLGFAARNSSTPVQAFTLTFDQAAYDESEIAREMAARAGAKFYPIPIKQSDLANHFEDAIWHSETLFSNGHGISKFLLSRAVRDAGYKVVYTGEGSDEIFGGYVHFRTDMLEHNAQGQDPAEVKRLLQQLEAANTVSRGLLIPAGNTGSLESVKRLLGFIPSCLKVFAAQGQQRLQLLGDDFMDRFAGRDSTRLFLDGFDVPAVLNGRDALNKSLFVWAKGFLPTYILNLLGDRMEMAHSIEGRVPFLDHRVVECVGRAPVSMKIRGLTEKYLLREAAKPVITDTVYRRQKHPFLSPPVTITPTERFHEMMQDTLRGPLLSAVPFYDKKKVVALLDRVPAMPSDDRIAWDPILMSVLSACVIQQRFQLGSEPAYKELVPDLESDRQTAKSNALAPVTALADSGHNEIAQTDI